MPLRPNLVERALIRTGQVPGLVLDLLLPLGQFWAVAAAAELGLFERLRDGPLELQALARRTRCAPSGLEALVEALVGLGYLEYHAPVELPHGEVRPGGYSLTKAARRSLPLEDLRATAPYWRLLAATYAGVADAVRTPPRRALAETKALQAGPAAKAYGTALRSLAAAVGGELVQRVQLPLRPGRLVEAGSGHGAHAVAFCRRHASLHGTVAEPQSGLRWARQTLRESPDVADRLDVVRLDVTREGLPGDCDLVVLDGVVRRLGPEGVGPLFARVAAGTTERGTVAIIDRLAGVAGSGLDRAASGLIGLGLFLTEGAAVHPYGDVERALGDAGFREVRRYRLEGAPGLALVVGRKAGG